MSWKKIHFNSMNIIYENKKIVSLRCLTIQITKIINFGIHQNW